MKKIPLYQQIVYEIETLVKNGSLRTGNKVPSIRNLSRSHAASITTVLRSYAILESRGVIVARKKSGYYVTNRCLNPDNPKLSVEVREYNSEKLVEDVHEASKIPGIIKLGAGLPDPTVLPTQKLNKILLRTARRSAEDSATYLFPPGDPLLRRQISCHAITFGCTLSTEKIIITTGASEALLLSILTVSDPGDIIVVESPCYFGILQMLSDLGRRAIEIPTRGSMGLDRSILEKVLRKRRVAACITSPTLSNPMGSVVEEAETLALYSLLAKYEIPIIEDDVYGDLVFDGTRPRPLKGNDKADLVLYCSSFSKTVAPGYRVGFVEPGKCFSKLKRLKFSTSLASTSLGQKVMGDFLLNGGYARTLRNLRSAYFKQITQTSLAIQKYFPEGTEISRPAGGFYLWIKLPGGISSTRLYREALKKNISIAPGPLFSSSGKYDNYMRLSCGTPWSDEMEAAVKTLAKLASKAN